MKKAFIEQAANLYKLFSDKNRLDILYSLLDKELKVSDISKIIGISQSATSHHLKKLLDGKLVKKSAKARLFSIVSMMTMSLLLSNKE